MNNIYAPIYSIKTITMIGNEIQKYKKYLLCGAYIFIIVLSLWIRSGFPVVANAHAGHDDALFLHLAEQLLSGEWLGAYNNLTLAKGMFYPFFIAASAVTGIPLKLAEHFLYLFCSFLVSRFVVRTTRRESVGCILFILLALNPILWAGELARVIREGIYLSLSMALLTLTCAVFFPSKIITSNKYTYIIKTFIIGIISGCFWLTREEGIWLLPALITIVGFAFIHQWKIVGLKKTIIGIIPKSIAISIFSFCLVVGGVQYQNWNNYKIFESTEFHSAPFLRAYGAISRIHHDSPRRYVVFPIDARERAYSVSKAAREIKPYLDGLSGENWKRAGCIQVAPDCSEIASGWFMWAFRDAVALSGHYKEGDETMKYYERLAEEINTACDDKKIECSAPRATLAPVYKSTYLWDSLSVSKGVFGMLINFRIGDIYSRPSFGTPAELSRIKDLIGTVSDGNVRLIYIRGWIAAQQSSLKINLLNSEENISSTVKYSDAKDVMNAWPGFFATRFESYVLCEDLCKLFLGSEGVDVVPIALGTIIDQKNIKVYVDEFNLTANPIEEKRKRLQMSVAKNIAKFYALLMPIIFLLGIIGVVFGLIQYFYTNQILPMFVLAIACLIAVLTRVALLSFLEVTSIPSFNILYASPASPFVIIFAVVASYQLFDRKS